MIEIENVKKYYDKVESLSSVSATVEDASIFGIIGSNGGGKSTLLRVMAGIFRAEDGEVRYDGASVYENPAVKRRILYLSDDQFFLSYATMEDMRRIYASAYPSFDHEMYQRLYHSFGLNPTRRISTFSKGMQKQTALILALSCRPDFLLCDETFDGLDPVMRGKVKRILADEVAERGMTVIIASHNLTEVEDLCDHIALLHRGRILFVSELDQMKQNIHAVQAVFTQEIKAEALAPLHPIRYQKRGSMVRLVARGEAGEIRQFIEELGAEFCELIPLTLDEIFVSEMEERGYDCSELLG